MLKIAHKAVGLTLKYRLHMCGGGALEVKGNEGHTKTAEFDRQDSEWMRAGRGQCSSLLSA